MGNKYTTIPDNHNIIIQLGSGKGNAEAIPQITTMKELRKWIKQRYKFDSFTVCVRETGYYVHLSEANFHCYHDDIIGEKPTKTIVVQQF
jgi:hypothetical protein